MTTPTDRTGSAATRRWKVTLYEGGFHVDAADENEARHEALQCVGEGLDWFVVEEVERESEQ